MAPSTAPAMTITEHADDDGVLVRVTGRLDRRSAADVRVAMHRVLVPFGPPVLLDLEDAVLGDATAVGLLVEARRRALRHGVDLRVTVADARSRRLLRRVRLQGILGRRPQPAGCADLAGGLRTAT